MKKAELVEELEQARKKIAALEIELSNREHDREDDVIPDTTWAQLRAALEGRAGLDADHMDLVGEAAKVVTAYDAIPDGVEEIAGTVWAYTEGATDEVCEEVTEAFELLQAWRAHNLDELASELWRLGLLRNGISLFEALESLLYSRSA